MDARRSQVMGPAAGARDHAAPPPALTGEKEEMLYGSREEAPVAGFVSLIRALDRPSCWTAWICAASRAGLSATQSRPAGGLSSTA